MDRKNKKKLIILTLVLVSAICAVLAGIKLYRVKEARTNGILLCFDDYDEYNWSEYFDLLDKYDAHVTYFVIIGQPTQFCYDAIERGHEIGYHSFAHTAVTEIEDDEEEFYECVVEPIETFREGGIELTTFAYPEGSRNEELDRRLLQYYKVVRGAYTRQFYGKDELREGFVDAVSIDNIHFEDDAVFEEYVDAALSEFDGNVGGIQIMFSHTIGDGEWSITPKRLEYLLKSARDKGIKFYTFKELQEG